MVGYFFDKSDGVSKIGTIVFVFAAISMLPLVINSRKKILIYGAINLVVFLLFMFYLYFNKETHDISVFNWRDIFVDITIAIIFTMIIHYNVFSINNIALHNAKEEIEQRKKIAVELEYHKDNLEELVKEKTNDLETANEELKTTNEELYEKNEIINRKNNELETTLKHLKETQAQLLQVEKMASLGTLTAGIAHEIYNPLNYLMGAYEGLNKYFEKYGSYDSNKTAILLGSIYEGIDRAANIVKGLNQFSRDNSNFDEDCSIHSIIDNCLIMLQNQIKHKAIAKKEYIDEEIIIQGNVGKLHQAFMNILTNSIQAIDRDGEILIVTQKDSVNAIVEISDNGCGISEENIKQVTDPFFTTKPPGQGTGLGLSITYSIVKEHGELLKLNQR